MLTNDDNHQPIQLQKYKKYPLSNLITESFCYLCTKIMLFTKLSIHYIILN